MENKELETWLKETKAKNLSYDELTRYIVNNCDIARYNELCNTLNAKTVDGISEAIFNQWQKEAEFSPKRGDRVLVWDDNEERSYNRIFVAEVKGAVFPFVTVHEKNEIDFTDNLPFTTEYWSKMKPLPTEQPTETYFKSKVIEFIEGKINATTTALETIIGIQKDLLEQVKNIC